VLQAGAALVLASAADRKRLGSSTFKDMNFGLVVSMVRPTPRTLRPKPCPPPPPALRGAFVKRGASPRRFSRSSSSARSPAPLPAPRAPHPAPRAPDRHAPPLRARRWCSAPRISRRFRPRAFSTSAPAPSSLPSARAAQRPPHALPVSAAAHPRGPRVDAQRGPCGCRAQRPARSARGQVVSVQHPGATAGFWQGGAAPSLPCMRLAAPGAVANPGPRLSLKPTDHHCAQLSKAKLNAVKANQKQWGVGGAASPRAVPPKAEAALPKAKLNALEANQKQWGIGGAASPQAAQAASSGSTGGAPKGRGDYSQYRLLNDQVSRPRTVPAAWAAPASVSAKAKVPPRPRRQPTGEAHARCAPRPDVAASRRPAFDAGSDRAQAC